MTYLFDTTILLHYVRQSPVMTFVESNYRPFDAANEPWICVVSQGELRSLAIQNNWGQKRILEMYSMLDDFFQIDIQSKEIYDRYAEIDAFSQGKLFGKPLGHSARNMGKNDLWIAACASVLGATLLTTDADFDHLNGVFLAVGKAGG